MSLPLSLGGLSLRMVHDFGPQVCKWYLQCTSWSFRVRANIYIYIHTYIYVYIYMCAYLFVCIYICTCEDQLGFRVLGF